MHIVHFILGNSGLFFIFDEWRFHYSVSCLTDLSTAPNGVHHLLYFFWHSLANSQLMYLKY